jgi:hypothetical protein
MSDRAGVDHGVVHAAADRVDPRDDSESASRYRKCHEMATRRETRDWPPVEICLKNLRIAEVDPDCDGRIWYHHQTQDDEIDRAPLGA